MAKDLEIALKISADGKDAESGIGRVISQLDDVATTSKKSIGKITAFEEMQTGLAGLEAKLAEATRARDDFVSGSDARKGAIITAAVNDAKAKLSELESAFAEAQRERDYFLNQADAGGNAGAKLFAKDIDGAKKSVLDLAGAIREQKATIESLPASLDSKAAKEATKGLEGYDKAVKSAGAAVQSETGKLEKLGKELQATGIDTRNLASEKERLAEKSLRAEQGSIKLKGQLLEEREAAKAATEKMREHGNAVDKTGDSAQSATGKTDGLVTGLKALAGAAVVREFIQANASLESIEKSLVAPGRGNRGRGKEFLDPGRRHQRHRAGRRGQPANLVRCRRQDDRTGCYHCRC